MQNKSDEIRTKNILIILIGPVLQTILEEYTNLNSSLIVILVYATISIYCFRKKILRFVTSKFK